MMFHSHHLSFKLKAARLPASENSKIYIILVFQIANMNSGTKGTHIYCSTFVQCSICTSDSAVSNVSVLATVNMKTNEGIKQKSKSTQFFHLFSQDSHLGKRK